MSKPDNLPESARAVLARIEHELRKDFTGEFRLVCSNGGVRTLKRIEHWEPGDMNGSRSRRARRAS